MKRFALFLALAASCFPVSLRADDLKNLGLGLAYAGFDIIGDENPLSAGADLLITRQFNGSVFDFGGTEFTLTGPVSLQISTATRFVPSIDISLNTAVDSRTQPTALSFAGVLDLGPQVNSVTGSTLIDADFSINALGFYDLTLTYSSRRTVIQEGIENDTQTHDSDIGPIDVSGNIFADALALITDPYFEQTGQANPFSDLYKTLIDPNPMELFDAAAFGGLSEGFLAEVRGRGRGPNLNPGEPRGAHSGAAHAVVPEPTVLVLLLLGVPVLIHRNWRTR